ncbi:MAG: mechanosensitive ion channel family protein [Lachnospiraceae bacterium]|nr:mechanosensitive ion channel family protein [Lachnospiraceae bacterium]
MENKEKIDKRHIAYRKRTVMVLSISAAVIVIFFLLMQLILDIEARKDQELDNERFFSSVISNLSKNENEIDTISEGFDENNEILLDNLVEAYSDNNYRKMKSIPVSDQSDLLLSASYAMTDCAWLLIVNSNADILISSVKENNSTNLLEYEDIKLSRKQFDELCDGTVDKVVIESPYKEYVDELGRSLYLYCKPIPGTYDRDGYKYILLAFSSHIIDTATDRMMDLSAWLNETSVGTNGSVFMIDALSDKIMYGSVKDEDMTGKKPADIGIDKLLLSDRYRGKATICGTRCYVSTRSYSSKLYGKDTYIIAAVPERDLYGMNFTVVIWNICLVLIFTILITAYSAYMRSEALKNKEDLRTFRLSKKYSFSRHLSGRIIPVVLLCSVIVFFMAFYFKDLLELSDAFSESVAIEEEITNTVDSANSIQKDFQAYHDEQYLGRAQLMSYIIELGASVYFDPKKAQVMELYDESPVTKDRVAVRDQYNNVIRVLNNSSALNDLCNKNNINSIHLISDTGVTLATSTSYWNYSLGTDSSRHSDEFWDVISGKKDSVVKDITTGEDGKPSQLMGCAMYYYTCLDDDKNTVYMSLTDYQNQNNKTYAGSEITRHRGLLQIETDPDSAVVVMEAAKPEYILANTKVSNHGFLMGFKYDEDEEDYMVFYSPKESMNGRYASELGISNTAFSGDYNGFQTLDSEHYLQSFRKSEDYYIATAMPVSSLSMSCVETSAFCALFCLLIMLTISCYAMIVWDMDREERYREETDPLAIFGHWKKPGKWGNTPPFEKFEMIIWNCLILLGCVFLASIFFEANRFGRNSAILYILSGEWDRGVHIFSLSACFVIIIISFVLIKMFGHVACLIASVFGSRGVTMMRLITGLIKVAAVAVVIMYCLYLMGIDATRLLTSAGIITAIVGLGAQSLVGDLLAGIFIIMEGALHVGDYVLINGVRGKVVEIGLRTTRYEDDNQNIRIICNNELKNFANMSMKYSVVLYNIPVPYEEDYQKIKTVLNIEFLQLYEDNRFLKGIPVCQGIEEFSESSVDLRVMFMCDEKDRYNVQRFMHDNIMRILTENDVHIPFNQIDIHVDRLIAKEEKEDSERE